MTKMTKKIKVFEDILKQDATVFVWGGTHKPVQVQVQQQPMKKKIVHKAKVLPLVNAEQTSITR